MRGINNKKTLQENAVYVGFAGETISIPGVGFAVHDGFSVGGVVVEARLTKSVGGEDNFVRNSNFFSVQNGATFIGNSAATTYTLDGWFIQHNGGSTSNVAQNTTFESAVNSETHAVVTTFTGGLASSFSIFTQTYNFLSRFAGKKLSLSYSIKSSADTSITNEFLLTFADGGTSNRGTLVGRESLKAGVWTDVRFTFIVPNIFSTDVIDNAIDNARLLFWLDAGDDFNARTGGILPFSGTFDIANVKIEESDEPTRYAFDDFTYELKKVQEYFEKVTSVIFMSSVGTSAFKSDCTLTFPFEASKWKDTYTTTIVDSFVSGNAVFSSKKSSLTLLGVATDVTSSARITEYTIDAEIAP